MLKESQLDGIYIGLAIKLGARYMNNAVKLPCTAALAFSTAASTSAGSKLAVPDGVSSFLCKNLAKATALLVATGPPG